MSETELAEIVPGCFDSVGNWCEAVKNIGRADVSES
jgi:hypothetical protein